MTPARASAVLRLGATAVTLLAGQALLWRAGRSLPALPLDSVGLARIATEADPLAVAVSVLRLVALAVGAGLLGATTLGLLARGCGAARLVAHVDRWTPPSLRRLLDGAVGVGLAASIGLGALPANADPGAASPPAATTLRRLPDATPDPTTTTLRRLPDATAAPPTTTLRRLPDAAPGPTTTTLRRPPGGPAAEPEAGDAGAEPGNGTPAATPPPTAQMAQPSAVAPPATPAPQPGEVVVLPGDSFWRLAERHETERLGRQPSETEVGAYWQGLVAANRHRLVVPGDPDLLFPGQLLVLP